MWAVERKVAGAEKHGDVAKRDPLFAQFEDFLDDEP
jgi:hypothetical protein